MEPSSIMKYGIRAKSLSFHLLLCYMLSIYSIKARGQVNEYEISSSTEAFTEIGESLLFGSYNVHQVFVNEEVHRDAQNVFGTGYDIGFPFYFDGAYYDRFSISGNGFIKLGTSADPFPIPLDATLGATFGTENSEGKRNTLSFFQHDIQPASGLRMNIAIREIYGLPGNRIHHIYMAIGYPSNIMYSTLTLFENDGSIQMGYEYLGSGRLPTEVSKLAVGLRGNAPGNPPSNIALLDIKEGMNTWADPALTNDPQAYCELNSSVFEPTMENFRGWMYRFTPPAGSLQPCHPFYFLADSSFPNVQEARFKDQPGVSGYYALADGNTGVPTTGLEIAWAKSMPNEASYDILLGVANSTPDTLARKMTATNLALPALAPGATYILERKVYGPSNELLYSCEATFSTSELEGYCQPEPQSPGREKVQRLQFNTLDYRRDPVLETLMLLPEEPGLTTQLQAGETYTFRLTNAIANSINFNLWLYIDFNRDGIWDFNTEETTLIGTARQGVVNEQQITIPQDIVPGKTRMRIKFVNQTASNATANEACGEDLTLINRQDYIITLQPSSLCQSMSINPSASSISCFGETSGNINLNLDGGTLPYTIQWKKDGEDIPQASPVLSQLGPGIYQAFILDNNGCQLQTDRIKLAQPLPYQVNTSTVATQCFGSATGVIELDITGGTSPYDVALGRVGHDLLTGTTPGGLLFENLVADQYTLAITDHMGCGWEQQITLSESQGNPLLIDTSTGPTACFGTSTGSIGLSISGGSMPYSVTLSQGEILSSTTTAGTAEFPGLPAGQYTVEVTDNIGCLWQQDISVAESQVQPLQATPSIADVACFETSTGSIGLSISGGTMPYNVTLSQGEILYSTATTGTAEFPGLPAGQYIVEITDNIGCLWLQDLAVKEKQGVPLECYYIVGEENPGTITIHCIGGTLPYRYDWDGGVANGFEAGPLDPGSYAVTITDDLDCITRLEGIVVTGNDSLITSLPGLVNTAPYQLYPNPGANTAWLTSATPKKVNIKISNANGQELTTFNLQLSAGKPAKLDLSHFSHGPLLITVSDRLTSKVFRFIKIE